MYNSIRQTTIKNLVQEKRKRSIHKRIDQAIFQTVSKLKTNFNIIDCKEINKTECFGYGNTLNHFACFLADCLVGWLAG